MQKRGLNQIASNAQLTYFSSVSVHDLVTAVTHCKWHKWIRNSGSLGGGRRGWESCFVFKYRQKILTSAIHPAPEVPVSTQLFTIPSAMQITDKVLHRLVYGTSKEWHKLTWGMHSGTHSITVLLQKIWSLHSPNWTHSLPLDISPYRASPPTTARFWQLILLFQMLLLVFNFSSDFRCSTFGFTKTPAIKKAQSIQLKRQKI